MSRLPPQPRSQLDGDQLAIYDEMDAFGQKHFGDTFTYKTKAGALLGPYAPLQYTPDLSRQFFGIIAELSKLPGFPVKAREVVILVVGTKYGAVYELYAHRRNAVKLGLSKVEVEAVCRGEKASSFDDKSNVSFDVAKELIEKPGPLTDEMWSRGLQVLGREGMTALIHFVGTYAYLSIVLNGFDCKVPEGEEM